MGKPVENYKPKSNEQIKLCINPDLLRPTRVSNSSFSFQQYASLEPISVKGKKNQLQLSMGQVQLINNKTKTCLWSKKDSKSRVMTPWIVQITKDCRYIWRPQMVIDKDDLKKLLQFILTSRSQQDENQCPSILINCGSYGSKNGESSYQTGDYKQTETRIYEQNEQVIQKLIGQQNIKLTAKNAKNKIYIHMLSTVMPCVYPENADHIIDALGSRAKSKILSQHLHPKGSLIKEQDLQFLDYPQLKNAKNIFVEQN